MKGRLIDHHDQMITMYKKDRDFAFYYLIHTLNDSSPGRFLKTFKDILESHIGSIKNIAKKNKTK